MELWKHQKKYGEKLYRREISALWWEPRTGKTLTAIHGSRNGTRLIICPKSVLSVWEQDLLLYGERDNWVFDRNKIPEHQPTNVIVNYETLWRTKLLLNHWDSVILDESHRISNINTKLFRYLQTNRWRQESSRIILLSGTPMVESGTQMITQYWWVKGNFAGFYDPWEALREFWTYDDDKYKWVPNKGTPALVKQLRSEIGHYMSQRQAGITLTKVYRIVPVYLDNKTVNAWKKYHAKQDKGQPMRLGDIQSFASGRDPEQKTKLPKTKLDAVVQFILDRELDEKMVIFCHFRESIVYLEEVLLKKQVKVRVIMGGDSDDTRKQNISQFGSAYDKLIAQVSTAREGINLSIANLIIYAENSLSGVVRIQSEERCTVKGKKAVEVVDFVSRVRDLSVPLIGDVDMHIQTLVKNKKDVNAKIYEGRLEDK